MPKGLYLKAVNRGLAYLLFLFAFIFLVNGCATISPVARANIDSSEYYPKASEDADTVLNLHSNIEKTTFYVDSKKIATGRRIKVLINSKRSYTILALPEGYISKEEFIQPPYMPNSLLSFTFLIGEKLKDAVANKEDEKDNKGKNQTLPMHADVDMQIPLGEKYGEHDVAVIIGNKNYSAAGIHDVEFADRDARIMKEYLTKTFGFRLENIIYAENATVGKFNEIFGSERDFRGKLYSFVKKNISEVFIYYVGHGAPDLQSQEAYFVPVDANPQYLSSNGYKLQTFYENLSKIPAKKITIVIDACFSGNSDKGMLFKNISPGMVKVKKEYSGPKNAVLITSAAMEQVSAWYPEKKHSLFTYYFLKGLRGEADVNKDNIITVGEMKNYLQEHVPYMARRLNGIEQYPVVDGNEKEIIVRIAK